MSTKLHEFHPEEVMAFLDGELPSERASVVGAHITQCLECAAVASELRKVSRDMAAWLIDEAPQTLDENVAAQLQSVLENQRSKRQRISFPRTIAILQIWFSRPYIWSAACLLIVALIVAKVFSPHLMSPPAHSAPSLDSSKIAPMDSQYNALPNSGAGRSEGGGRARSLPRQEAKSAYTRKSRVGATLGKIEGTEPVERSPMIARTAELKLIVEKLDLARAAMDQILAQHRGYIGQLSRSADDGSAQALTAVLRVPASQVESCLDALKKLGRVTAESQTGEEVTQEYVDLRARLNNARATEQRLLDVLRNRTGKVSEVLEVEEEIARVREEIERMDAERKNLEKRVEFATVKLSLTQEHKEQLHLTPPSAGTQIHNAVVEGYRDVAEAALDLVIFVLHYGPTLLLWAALLFFPARFAWRKLRSAAAGSHA